MTPICNATNNRTGSTGGQRAEDWYKDKESLHVHSRTLIEAFQGMIFTLVRAAIPNLNCLDPHQVSCGSEAEDLIIALQKYISHTIQVQAGYHHIESDGMIQTINPQGKIGSFNCSTTSHTTCSTAPDAPLVVRSTKDGLCSERLCVSCNNTNLTSMTLADTRSPYRQDLTVRKVTIGVPLVNEEMTFFYQALTALRTHVFNELPIRLLYSEKRGSDLEIALLDREGIYSHLALKLRDKVLHNVTPSTFKNIKDLLQEIGKYAILSHKWLHSTPGEVTYRDWHNGIPKLTQPVGYQKLVNFCSTSQEKHGYSLGWMDTVCIDKSSSSELDESIRSMYRWYEKAGVCITYLSNTRLLSDLASDPWFTRGWTLQELLAPQHMKFYGSDWTELVPASSNDKENIDVRYQITVATSITPNELMNFRTCAPISRRMQWAAKRQVTRGEDAAYSLMGIFDINMSTAYGEGTQRAFLRLLKEILNSTKHGILDLFNWAGQYDTPISSLLPSSPHAYLQRCPDDTVWDIDVGRLTEPVMLTHLGVRISVLLLAAEPTKPSTAPFVSIGDYYGTVNIQPICTPHLHIPIAYNILDTEGIVKPAPRSSASYKHQIVFGILNCSYDSPTALQVSRKCLAVALLYKTDNMAKGSLQHRIITKQPIIFQLQSKKQSTNIYTIEKSQLRDHGMQLCTMSL